MSAVMTVLKGSRYRVAKGGTEPTVHELAQAFYKSLGANQDDIKKWSEMYVEAVESTLQRQFPRQDRTIHSQKHRIELMQTEEGLLAKAKEMADRMFMDMVANMTNQTVNGSVVSSFDVNGLRAKDAE